MRSGKYLMDEFMAENVEDLECSCAIHDEFAVADEGEIVVVHLVVVSREHQFEARSIVTGFARKSIGWCGQQVDVGSGEIID